MFDWDKMRPAKAEELYQKPKRKVIVLGVALKEPKTNVYDDQK